MKVSVVSRSVIVPSPNLSLGLCCFLFITLGTMELLRKLLICLFRGEQVAFIVSIF